MRRDEATRGQGVSGNSAAAGKAGVRWPEPAPLPCSTATAKDTAKETRGKRRDMSDGDCSQVGKACCLGLQPTRGCLTKSFYQRFPQNHTERWRERGSHAA